MSTTSRTQEGARPAKRVRLTEEERKARRRESKRRWYTKNPEKARESARRRRAKNPEKARESCRRWRATHPEVVRKNNRRWNAKFCRARRSGQPTHYDRARACALILLGGRCAVCGETNPAVLQIDHINGGGNTDRLARPCNVLARDLAAGKEDPQKFRLLCANHNWLAHLETHPSKARAAERVRKAMAEQRWMKPADDVVEAAAEKESSSSEESFAAFGHLVWWRDGSLNMRAETTVTTYL